MTWDMISGAARYACVPCVSRRGPPLQSPEAVLPSDLEDKGLVNFWNYYCTIFAVLVYQSDDSIRAFSKLLADASNCSPSVGDCSRCGVGQRYSTTLQCMPFADPS